MTDTKGKRWTDDEIKAVKDYLWARTDDLPQINRTDDAIESKFSHDLRQIRKIGQSHAVRHEASKVALATVRHKGIKHEGRHIADCNRAVTLAFFVGGFNTDPLAQKCRKAALDYHNKNMQAA